MFNVSRQAITKTSLDKMLQTITESRLGDFDVT